MFRKKDEPTPATSTPAPLPTRAPAPATPAAAPTATSSAPAPSARAAEPATDKRLIVGEGLSLSGDITSCDLLVVEGSVQVTLNDTRAIEISETGRFTNGKAAVEEATISGVYEGELTVRGRLLVRGTGRVDGRIRYGELEVERGGRLSGSIEILGEAGAASPAPAAPKPAPAFAGAGDS